MRKRGVGRHEFLFLYIDAPMVQTFIAQHDRIHITGETHAKNLSTESQLGASLDFLKPFSASAGRRSVKGFSDSQTGTPTPESEFVRFYDNLQSDGRVQYLEALDLAIWGQLQIGEFVDIRARVNLPLFSHLIRQAKEARQAMVVSTQMGVPIPPQVTAAVKAIEALVETIDTVPIIASLAGSPRFRFVSRLQRRYMPREETSLEDAECMVFGKIERVLHRGERIPATDLFPATLGRASSHEARGLTESVAQMRSAAQARTPGVNVPDDPVFVEYPAAKLATLAVYR